VAQQGFKLLLRAIEDPQATLPPAPDPPVEIIVRASTAPPPTQKILGQGQRVASPSNRGRNPSTTSDGGRSIQH
jgi:hypothetical protein